MTKLLFMIGSTTVSLALAGCQSDITTQEGPTQTEASADNVAAQSVQAEGEHSPRVALDWNGTYVGTVPCASCPGIDMQLVLGSDGSYELIETYQGDDKSELSSEGNFEWNAIGTAITLDDEDKRVFVVGENRIWLSDEGGRRDELYVLAKK